MQLGILGMELHPAAERLDLVLVEHLGQLVELDLCGGLLRPLLDAVLLLLDGARQAEELRVLVDLHQALVLGIGLQALGEDLLGLVEIAVLAIDIGELDVGVGRRRVADDLLDQALLGRELFLLELVELGLHGLGGVLDGLGLGSVVKRVVELGPLDGRGGREGVDLPVGVRVVWVEFLDVFPAGDGLGPALVGLVNGAGELEEVVVLALGRHLRDRVEQPDRQRSQVETLGRVCRDPRRSDVPGIIGEGILAVLERLVMLALPPGRLRLHQERLVLHPHQHPDFLRIVGEFPPLDHAQ